MATVAMMRRFARACSSFPTPFSYQRVPHFIPLGAFPVADPLPAHQAPVKAADVNQSSLAKKLILAGMGLWVLSGNPVVECAPDKVSRYLIPCFSSNVALFTVFSCGTHSSTPHACFTPSNFPCVFVHNFTYSPPTSAESLVDLFDRFVLFLYLVTSTQCVVS